MLINPMDASAVPAIVAIVLQTVRILLQAALGLVRE
jgi:hypothetical protein